MLKDELCVVDVEVWYAQQQIAVTQTVLIADLVASLSRLKHPLRVASVSLVVLASVELNKGGEVIADLYQKVERQRLLVSAVGKAHFTVEGNPVGLQPLLDTVFSLRGELAHWAPLSKVEKVRRAQRKDAPARLVFELHGRAHIDDVIADHCVLTADRIAHPLTDVIDRLL